LSRGGQRTDPISRQGDYLRQRIDWCEHRDSFGIADQLSSRHRGNERPAEG
jgi:hypothetical protein